VLRSFASILGSLHRRIGLLLWASALAFVFARVVHRCSSLPQAYTWFEPLRTMRLVLGIEYFPTAILATLAAAMLRKRGEWNLGHVLGRLRTRTEVAPFLRRIAPALGLGLALACVDAFVFPDHSVLDGVSVVAIGFGISLQPFDRGKLLRLAAHAVVATAALMAICYCYTVLKALTFAGHRQVDASIAAVEHALVGLYPHRAVATWAADRPTVVAVCDWVYFRFFHHMVLTAVLLLGLRQGKQRIEYLGALALCYLIGGPLYHVFPAVGPGYSEPPYYAFLARGALTTNEIRLWLLGNTTGVMNGTATELRTWGYIACMPSLHVAHELVMLWYARRSRLAFAASALFSAMTILSVVVLGWHYFLDCVGSFVVAGFAIGVAHWQRDRLMPAALADLQDVPLPPRPRILAPLLRRLWSG